MAIEFPEKFGRHGGVCEPEIQDHFYTEWEWNSGFNLL